MKLGRTFAGGPRRRWPRRPAGATPGTSSGPAATAERVAPLAEVDPDRVPYISLALLPSPARRAPGRAGRPTPGEVTVVGLGPAGPAWLTPEAQAALAAADDLVGYGPYLAGCRQRPRPAPARLRQPRRGGAGARSRWSWPPRARGWRSCRPATRASSRWPPRCSRWPPTARTLARRRGPGGARADRGAGGGQPGRRAARATTSACSRCPTGSSRGTVIERRLRRRGRGRPGARALQPGLADPHLAARARARDVLLRAPRAGRRRWWSAATSAARGERVTVTTLGELDPADGRHAHAADRRLVATRSPTPRPRVVYTARRAGRSACPPMGAPHAGPVRAPVAERSPRRADARLSHPAA